MVFTCDEKIGTLGRKEGDGNGTTKEEEQRPKRKWLEVKNDMKEKGLSADEVYDRPFYMEAYMSSYIIVGIR